MQGKTQMGGVVNDKGRARKFGVLSGKPNRTRRFEQSRVQK
jgi:hypothetical protein